MQIQPIQNIPQEQSDEYDYAPQPGIHPMYNPPQYEAGLLKYQLDNYDIIEELEHLLRNEEPHMDPDTNELTWVTKKNQKALINESGISSINVLLKSRLTKVFILSALDDEYIEALSLGVANNMIDLLYENWDEFAIRDNATASLIVSLVTDTVFATLCKGRYGKYLDFLKTTQRVSEIEQRRSYPHMDQNPNASVNNSFAAKLPGVGRFFR